MDGEVLKLSFRRKRAAHFHNQQKASGIPLLSGLFGKAGACGAVQAAEIKGTA